MCLYLLVQGLAQNFSYNIRWPVADILVGAFLGRIMCSTGPWVRIYPSQLGPFVPPVKAG